MINKIRLTVLICSIILFSACASIAQYEEWETGESGWETGESGWETSGSGWETSGSGSSTWGQADPAEISSASEDYFPSNILESSSTLIDETTSPQYSRASVSGGSGMMMAVSGGSQNLFWIVSKNGAICWRSVDMPQYRYARMLLIPSTSGQLIMEELYPTGQVRTYYFGNVRAHNQYRIWFYADTSGTHRLRYKINNGPYSDILTFHVKSSTPNPNPNPNPNPSRTPCPCCGGTGWVTTGGSGGSSSGGSIGSGWTSTNGGSVSFSSSYFV